MIIFKIVLEIIKEKKSASNNLKYNFLNGTETVGDIRIKIKELEQDKDVQRFKEMLNLMKSLLDREYMSYVNASYLLAPVIACAKEGKHPLYDITHLKEFSGSSLEKRCMRMFQQD